jgi:hypothetical protein
MNRAKPLLLTLLLVGCTLASGCVALLAGAAGAAGGVVYLKGQLESYEPQPFDTVVAAIRKTATKENFGDTTATVEDGKFSLRGKDVGDTFVWIRAYRKETNVTQVLIRSGAMGDETESQRLLEVIRAQY